MSQFAKFTLKTLDRPQSNNPIDHRRARLVAAIEIQKLVLAAAIKGDSFTLPAKSDGKQPKPVRAWFVAQDGGYYVQCRYGARPLLLDGASNALFVNKLSEVGAALAAFEAATKSGELDEAIAATSKRKKA